MSAFSPKVYQQQVLDSVEAYFRACHELPSPAVAFTVTTDRLWGRGQPYHPLAGFPLDMPYFCLRVPTGGGKTWLAAKSVALVNTQLLRSEHSVILWLVPSKPIREQTLRALKNPAHPYHAALREAGSLTVMDLEEAKSVSRATLDTSTTVIVATRQAFQVEDEESRKVYQSSGALMHHFEHLSPAQRGELLFEGEGAERTMPCSLANVLRLRRPFVIVDEAHNSRTELAFDMLARFRPGGVMELTATPDLERTPSNVLHSVSAAELKAEEMIKLPVVLETEPDWQQCLAAACARRDALQAQAEAERLQHGTPYLRPVVLIQSQPRRAGVETLDFERVREELIVNQGVPADEIVVATGEERGLEALDAQYRHGIADPGCPVRFVITQQALAEGWDCPFAYILVSLASLSSSTAVEQLLGRVLRQPNAQHFSDRLLNQSYAFVVSRNFAETANSLRDRLVAGAGFERREVAEFVTAARAEQGHLDLAGHARRVVLHPVTIALPEKPNLKLVTKPVRDKLSWDAKAGTLTITAPLSAEEGDELKATVSDAAAAAAIVAAAETSRTTAIEFFQTPAEAGERLRVPQLALRLQGELQLFDDPQVLDFPWEISRYDAKPTADDLAALGAGLKVSEGGEIDVDDGGHVVSRFLPELQRDLGLVYQPEHWDEVRLAAWLCRNLPEPASTHASKLAFVTGWLTDLLGRDGWNLARANLQKFLIRDRLEARIRELRKLAVTQAFQQTLFGPDSAQHVEVSDQFTFEFHAQAYAPPRDYDGRFGRFEFRKHFYGRIGDFDSGEEFECACWIDQQAQSGRIKFWVRNLVRREGCSFFLQKADGRFYPDFLCQLPDEGAAPGPILAVEYKGADRWPAAADDRLIGGLWQDMSAGRCRFVMVKDKCWDGIDAKLN